jgi:hypothetical protein
MHKKFVIILLSFVFLSCSSGVKYLGNSYPATETVKIYFSKSDIDEPYEMIGKVYLDIEENTKDEKIQNLILNKAKQHGGNAVIMGDLQVVRSGTVSGGSGASTNAGKNVRIGGGAKKTKTTNNLRMEIEVIRFKTEG